MSREIPLSTKLKNFYFTYRSTLAIAWNTDKALFSKLTLVNALNGALVYPQLLVGKMLIDAVMISIASHNPSLGVKNMVIAALLSLAINQATQFLSNLDSAYSYTMSNLVGEKISVSISRKINDLPVSLAELPATRNTLQKVLDNTGRSVWQLVIPISSFPDTIFTIISTAIPIISFQPLILVPCILLAIPSITVGITFSREWHKFRTEQAPKWRVWSALEEFSIRSKYLYENKILDHVDLLLKRRVKMSKKFYSQENNLRLRNARRRQLVSIPTSLFDVGNQLYLYYLAIIQKITLGTAQITSQAIGSFIRNTSRLIQQGNDVYQNYLFIQDYENFMALPDDDNSKTLELPSSLNEGIEFRNVWFKYNSSPNWILKGVSFKLDPHDNIAIVGENGAGKTTIIKLLCRFYEPQKGEIFVNGHNISDYNLKSYRHGLSALFQDFAQYPFSATDNIHFGDITVPRKLTQIKKTAHLTGIDSFIETLPMKYKNPLDKEFENGIEPSKGQWQRVALARTLFRKSPILILDEPTSNVDPESEEEIFDQVLNVTKDKIVFLVSHRFSTVRKADKILVLEKGSVAEFGSHDQLMARNGRYKKLFSLQAKSYQ